MLPKTKMALVAVLLASSGSAALAQYDGDGNRVPGAHQRGAIVERTPSFENAFAAPLPTLVQYRQLDGDENPVPGSGR